MPPDIRRRGLRKGIRRPRTARICRDIMHVMAKASSQGLESQMENGALTLASTALSNDAWEPFSRNGCPFSKGTSSAISDKGVEFFVRYDEGNRNDDESDGLFATAAYIAIL
jgi:hypothetical protein